MQINPVQFAQAIRDEFLRYILSAFPRSNPDVAEQTRLLLQRPASPNPPLRPGNITRRDCDRKADLR